MRVRLHAPAIQGQAKQVMERFDQLFGPNGQVRSLAESWDRFQPWGDRREVEQLVSKLALGSYAPEDQLRFDSARTGFQLGDQALTRDAAEGAVAEALADGRVSPDILLSGLDFQAGLAVERAREGFTDLQSSYLLARRGLRALQGKSPPTRAPLETTTAFERRDAVRATRLFRTLGAAHERAQEQWRQALARVPEPTTAAESIHYLTLLSYAPSVAKQLVEEAPEIAAKLIRFSRSFERLTTEAPDGWQHAFPGALAFQPMRLYRGVDAQVMDPRWKFAFGGKQAGREFAFTSDRLGYPWMRSMWSFNAGRADSGRTHGIIAEYQAPAFLVKLSDNEHPVLVQSELPDHSPVIARLGRVRFTPENERRSDNGSEEMIRAAVEWTERDSGLLAPKPT